jgi:hypothetical protein
VKGPGPARTDRIPKTSGMARVPTGSFLDELGAFVGVTECPPSAHMAPM